MRGVDQFRQGRQQSTGDVGGLLGDELVVGNRAEPFVARRGTGRALAVLPDARAFLRLPSTLLIDRPSPIYGRTPDAKPTGGA